MTLEQSQKASAWLNAHWTNRNCPLHGPTLWQLDTWLAEVRAYAGGSLIVGGGQAIFPLLVVTCTKCGYVVFVNAIMAGIVESKSPDTSVSVEPPKNEAG